MARLVPIPYKQLICIVEKLGFVYQRTKGSHMVYVIEETFGSEIVFVRLVFAHKFSIAYFEVRRRRGC